MRGHPLQTAVYGQRNGRTGCQLAGSAGMDRLPSPVAKGTKEISDKESVYYRPLVYYRPS